MLWQWKFAVGPNEIFYHVVAEKRIIDKSNVALAMPKIEIRCRQDDIMLLASLHLRLLCTALQMVILALSK